MPLFEPGTERRLARSSMHPYEVPAEEGEGAAPDDPRPLGAGAGHTPD